MPMSQSEDAWTAYEADTTLSREEFDRLVWRAGNERSRRRRDDAMETLKRCFTGTWSSVDALLRTAAQVAKGVGSY